MKHFFMYHKEKGYILGSCFAEGRCSISEYKTKHRRELFQLLMDELRDNKETVNDYIIKQFMLLYDAADIIYDKRLDKYDWKAEKKQQEELERKKERKRRINPIARTVTKI